MQKYLVETEAPLMLTALLPELSPSLRDFCWPRSHISVASWNDNIPTHQKLTESGIQFANVMRNNPAWKPLVVRIGKAVATTLDLGVT